MVEFRDVPFASEMCHPLIKHIVLLISFPQSVVSRPYFQGEVTTHSINLHGEVAVVILENLRNNESSSSMCSGHGGVV